MEWTSIVVAALGGGAVGGAVTPWAQYPIETRRSRQQQRSKLIAEWRAMVTTYLTDNPEGPEEMADSAPWLSLRPHLTEGTRRLVEAPGNTLTISTGTRGIAANHPLKAVSNEIDALERKWKLV